MWSEPVTLGGGMTMQKGSAPSLAPAPARNASALSHSSRMRGSSAAAS
jgi:hypothetical protein